MEKLKKLLILLIFAAVVHLPQLCFAQTPVPEILNRCIKADEKGLVVAKTKQPDGVGQAAGEILKTGAVEGVRHLLPF